MDLIYPIITMTAPLVFHVKVKLLGLSGVDMGDMIFPQDELCWKGGAMCACGCVGGCEERLTWWVWAGNTLPTRRDVVFSNPSAHWQPS